jgi:hypothetical protein
VTGDSAGQRFRSLTLRFSKHVELHRNKAQNHRERTQPINEEEKTRHIGAKRRLQKYLAKVEDDLSASRTDRLVPACKQASRVGVLTKVERFSTHDLVCVEKVE